MNSEERLLRAIFGTEETEEEAEARLRALRTRKALGQAPELAQHLRAKLHLTDGRTEPGIEFRVMATPLLTTIADDADELYVRLIDWRTHFARWITFEPAAAPKALRNFGDSHQSLGYADAPVLGFEAGTTPTMAATLIRRQSGWLLDHDTQINLLPDAAEYQADITNLIWGLRARHALTPAKEREVSPRVCEVCSEAAVVAVWSGARATDVEIYCEHCGTVMPTPRPSLVEKWISTADPAVILSEKCDQLVHEKCRGVHCECWCHDTPRPSTT